MVLTREQLVKMDKDAVIDYALSLGKLDEKLSSVEKRLQEKLVELEGTLVLAKNANELLKKNNDKLEARIVCL